MKFPILPLIFLALPLFLWAQKPVSTGNTQNSLSCVGCFVSQSEMAFDASTSTFALVDPTALPLSTVGYVSQDYSFAAALAIGSELRLDLAFSDHSILAGLLGTLANDLVFDRLEIELLNGTTVVSTYGGSSGTSLAELDVVDAASSRFNLLIQIPTANIDGIRIRTGALISLGAGITPSVLEVYDIEGMPTDRYYASRFTGNSGQNGSALTSCLSCGVFNEVHAASLGNDPNSQYAQMRWDIGLSLLGTEYQYIEYDWDVSPNTDFLGDADGTSDAVVIQLQETALANLGLDLGSDLWDNNGLALMAQYSDGSSSLLDNSSPLLSANLLGAGSGRFQLVLNIPAGKTLERVEIRRTAPTLGLLTELRIYNVYSVSQASLPLKLAYFKTKKEPQKGILLEWQTESEYDMDQIVVQRAGDDMLFEVLYTLSAQNDPQQNANYEFVDEQPLGGNNYYRLQFVGFAENDISYSVVKVENWQQNKGFTLYRQGDNLRIQKIEQDRKELLKLEVYSLQGQLLLQQNFAHAQAELNTADLPKIFQLQVVGERQAYYQELIPNP
ncbi:hypothetical protein SapgrDRAFT_0516 [Saprospira grandis DSM 2844]|uniref:Uncharacterized protein n=1 Tax=Saprospira grandis DSM 2844 TaxID=694433 RepID=J1I0S2_9BACT|nr:hypothetical protein [Saprospira grandis]EJF52260.1 hypothetical protein SapgrDRAFT_0516 [Saprospira grandis DSM 2844]